jgi:predicted dehydrogenase
MGNVSRRKLLVDSLFAAAAAATAGSVQSGAWAAPQKDNGKKFGPNDQIRVAVIGVRGRGKEHLNGYCALPDVTIAAICDCDLSVVGPALKIVKDAGRPDPKVVQDLRRIMDDPNIDAVSIATPNHWHSLAAIWAMQAGKDVYVEKPVSHNIREGRVMVDTARKLGRICQAGTQCRSMQGTIDAINYVHSGKIGKVTVSRGLCYKPRPSIGKKDPGTVPTSLDYNLWVGPAEMQPYHQNRLHYNWHWVFNTGNGDLGNQGIHQMDLARWGLQKDTLPKTTVGLGGRFGYEDDGETPNTHVTVHDYGDSLLVFETRGLPTRDYKGAKIGNIFHGTDGYVVLNTYTTGAAFDRDGNLVTSFKGGGDHFRNFIDAMRSRNPADLRGEILEGHLSSTLCHLGNVSYLLGDMQPFNAKTKMFGDGAEAYETLQRTEEHLAENGLNMQSGQYRLGKKLTINAKKENFGKDEQANAFLTRNYREGFVVPDKA